MTFRSRAVYCGLWALALTITSACRQNTPQPLQVTPTAATEFLHIGLTSAATGLDELVGPQYQRPSSLARLDFITANAETLYDDLDNGFLEAILVHEVPSNSQYWFNPIAMDGLVIIVHPENKVDDLNKDVLGDVFANRTSHWAALGGPDLPISLFAREPGSGARAIFDERLLAGRALAATANIASGDSAMRTAVASEPGAIGYSMMGSADSESVVSIDGMVPSVSSVADQSYPLTVPLYFVSLSEPAGELRAFLAWLQSTNGQEVLGEKYGRLR